MAPKRECAKNAQAPKEKKIKLMENDTGEAKGAKKKRPTRAKKAKSTKNSKKNPEFQNEFQDEFQDELQEEFKEEFGYYTMGTLN